MKAVHFLVYCRLQFVVQIIYYITRWLTWILIKKVSFSRVERIIKNIVGTNLVCRNGFFQSAPFRAWVVSHFSDFSHLKSPNILFLYFFRVFSNPYFRVWPGQGEIWCVGGGGRFLFQTLHPFYPFLFNQFFVFLA